MPDYYAFQTNSSKGENYNNVYKVFAAASPEAASDMRLIAVNVIKELVWWLREIMFPLHHITLMLRIKIHPRLLI